MLEMIDGSIYYKPPGFPASKVSYVVPRTCVCHHEDLRMLLWLLIDARVAGYLLHRRCDRQCLFPFFLVSGVMEDIRAIKYHSDLNYS